MRIPAADNHTPTHTDERKEIKVDGAGGASHKGLAFAVNDVVSLV